MPDPVRVSSGIVGNATGGQIVTVDVEPDFFNGTEKIPAEVRLMRETSRVLMEHYPGHNWGIQARMADGLIGISIPALLGDWHYWLHLDAFPNGKSFEEAVKEAGGNILERFNIPRSAINFAHYADARANIPMIGRFRASSPRNLIPA